MIIGSLKLSIIIRGAHSLKDKRQVIRSLKERLKNKFNVAVAETDFNDVWQRAELGVATVGNDTAFVESVLAEVLRYVGNNPDAELVNHEKELI